MYCIQFGGLLRPRSAAPIVKVFAAWQQTTLTDYSLAGFELSLNEQTGQVQFLIYTDTEDNVRKVTDKIATLMTPYEAFLMPENRINIAAVTALHEKPADNDEG